MNRIKKGVAIFIIATLSRVAFAEDVEDRLSEVERRLDRIYIVTPNGTCGATTGLARPIINSCNSCCGSNWFIEASVIYWHAKVGGSEYAYTKQNPVSSFPVKGRVKSMDFKWDWGFKADIGYNFAHDGWETVFRYVFFDTSGSDGVGSGLNDSVIPMRGAATLVTPVSGSEFFLYCSEAKSQYDFSFNSLSWEFARDFFVSACFSIRPFTALQATWLDLEQNTRYINGASSSFGFGLNNDVVSVKDKSKFRGLGPSAGFDLGWHLGKGFSLFQDATIGMLFGIFDVRHREKYSASSDAKINLRDTHHGFSPMMKFQSGIAYKTYFNEDRNHLTIRLGYETQYWWRVNQMLRVEDTITGLNPNVRYSRYSEDASLMGCIFDLRIDF